jgi:hypothetical protein
MCKTTTEHGPDHDDFVQALADEFMELARKKEAGPLAILQACTGMVSFTLATTLCPECRTSIHMQMMAKVRYEMELRAEMLQ